MNYDQASSFFSQSFILLLLIRKMTATGFNTSFGGSQYNHLGNSLGSDKKAQTEYKKIFCAYHSNEFLTNFCIDKQCLMPLCPTCVVEHTEEHYQCQQKPAYVNLNDAMQQVKQKCYSSIIKLEQFNRKNVELSNYIQGLPDYIRKQLTECKEKLYQFIDQKFQIFENKLIDDIRAKYAEDGVYSRKQCEEVKQFISNEIQVLYDKITQLKGDQCLAALIRYYQSDQRNLENEMNEIVDYVEKNRKAGGLYISLNNEELLRNYQNICDKLVTLQYIQQDESKSFNSTRNLQNQTSKKNMTSSQVNKVGLGNKSNVKQKSANKFLSQSQSYSSQKQQQKGYYLSPFKNGGQF